MKMRKMNLILVLMIISIIPFSMGQSAVTMPETLNYARNSINPNIAVSDNHFDYDNQNNNWNWNRIPYDSSHNRYRCPNYSPPLKDWCKDGKIICKGYDSNGCIRPPTCVPKPVPTPVPNPVPEPNPWPMPPGDRYCIDIYRPVCGWFGDNVKCFAYPCAQTYSNTCYASKDPNVVKITQGVCPQPGSNFEY